jgi:amino acid transporter
MALAKPSHQLPRAMYLALGIATVIYVAVALGVFGTLTVEKVISSGGTALAAIAAAGVVLVTFVASTRVAAAAQRVAVRAQPS